jgi:hypothetical protein
VGAVRLRRRDARGEPGSLIEVVNRYGSFVCGSLLGVSILAIMTTRATARGAFWG